MLADRVIVKMVTDPTWVTAVIAAGSAILGAVTGAVATARAERRAARRQRAVEDLRRSQGAAGELIDDVYELSRRVEEGVANTSPTLMVTAANDFAQRIPRKLASITDEELASRVMNHRTYAAAVGISGTPGIARTPPPGLTDALNRHAEAVMASLEAHIQGAPLPAYRAPEFSGPAVLEGLIAWENVSSP